MDDWMKMRIALYDDPKTILVRAICQKRRDKEVQESVTALRNALRNENVTDITRYARVTQHSIARYAGLQIEHIVGCLMRAWQIPFRFTKNAVVPGWSAAMLDEYCHLDGLAEAMADPRVGWLVIEDDSLQFVNFEEFNGDAMRGRTLAAERQARYRQRKSERNGGVTGVAQRNAQRNVTDDNTSDVTRCATSRNVLRLDLDIDKDLKTPPTPRNADRNAPTESGTNSGHQGGDFSIFPIINAWYDHRGGRPPKPTDSDLAAERQIVDKAPLAREPDVMRQALRYVDEDFPGCNSLAGAAGRIITVARRVAKDRDKAAKLAAEKQARADAEAKAEADKAAEARLVDEYETAFDQLSDSDRAGWLAKVPAVVRNSDLGRVEAIKLFAKGE